MELSGPPPAAHSENPPPPFSPTRAASAPPIARLPASMLHLEAPAPPPAPLALLDVLARTPAAAPLIFAALDRDGRRALRLVHPELRDAVAQETTKLRASLLDDEHEDWWAPGFEVEGLREGGEREFDFADNLWEPSAIIRSPTALRWPAVRRLELGFHGRTMVEAFEALSAAPWRALTELVVEGAIFERTDGEELGDSYPSPCGDDWNPDAEALTWEWRDKALNCWGCGAGAAEARALAAAAAQMPKLRRLELRSLAFVDDGAAALFASPSSWLALEEICTHYGDWANDVFERLPWVDETTAALAAAWGSAPRLRSFTMTGSVSEDAARALAASGARLEELRLELRDFDGCFGDDAVDALVASRSFALRRLKITECQLSSDALRSLAATTCRSRSWQSALTLAATTPAPRSRRSRSGTSASAASRSRAAAWMPAASAHCFPRTGRRWPSSECASGATSGTKSTARSMRRRLPGCLGWRCSACPLP